MKKLSLAFAEDPGHGWLLVTEEQMKEAGIHSGHFSQFSYYDPETRTFALEEDCDAALFLKALEKQGIDHTIREQIHSDGDSFVRSWPRITRQYEFA